MSHDDPLANALARIRKPQPTVTSPGAPAGESTDPSADRLTYAGFPPAMREAMKIAAQRWSWDRETWRYQTALIQETLLSGRYDTDELAVAYRNPPP